jgi:hypothetical protein
MEIRHAAYYLLHYHNAVTSQLRRYQKHTVFAFFPILSEQLAQILLAAYIVEGAN